MTGRRRFTVFVLAGAVLGPLGCAGSASGPVDKALMSDEEWIEYAGRGTDPYPETLVRLDVLGEEGPFRGTVRRDEGEDLEFWWPGGSTERPYRPLRDRLADPAPHRNLYLVETDPRRRREIRKKVPVAGPLESRILGLFHQLISRYVLEKEADTVLERYRKSGKGRRLFDEGFSALEQRTLDLLDLTRFLEEQGALYKQGAFPYWERRAVVYVSALCDTAGRVERAEVLAGYDRPGTADSLLARVRGWTLPVPDWEGRKPIRFKVLVPFAVDRREKLLGRAPEPWWPVPDPVTRIHRFVRVEMVETTGLDSEPLPRDVRDVLETGALAGWTRTFREFDPAFSLDDFLSTTHGRLPELESPGYWKREAERKRELGLLVDSPGGEWTMDPFFRVAPGKSRTEAENLTGWAVLPRKSPEVMRPWVWPEDDIRLAAWADANTFVLVGWSEVKHPRLRRGALLEFRVPTIWVGDTVSWTFRKFLGAPVDPRALPGIRRGMEILVNAAYPPGEGS